VNVNTNPASVAVSPQKFVLPKTGQESGVGKQNGAMPSFLSNMEKGK